MSEAETIVAIATPPGVGGIGVVRLSGPDTWRIAAAVLGSVPVPRRARLGPFLEDGGEAIDQGLALFFPGPRSLTGEDVLELQAHGGPVVLDALVGRCLGLGARMAQPGEFSQRAFLNGKLDLAQAEAVADLIASGSRAAARAAMRSLEGQLSREVRELGEALTELRVLFEAAIDFPDDDPDALDESTAAQRLASLLRSLWDLAGRAHKGRLVQEGMTVVLAGPPNTGKSSLLNQLAGTDSAIVTPIPGTTRDLLRERIQLDGLPLHVVDTAGLRDSADPVEVEGVRRAQQAVRTADRVLLVVEDTCDDAALGGVLERLPRQIPVTVLRNKVDLSGAPPGAVAGTEPATIRISALTGAGIEALRAHLKSCAGYQGPDTALFSARRRHQAALQEACRQLETARQSLALGAHELVAEDLRGAQRALGEVTGEVTTEELLGRIFASFCIGK